MAPNNLIDKYLWLKMFSFQQFPALFHLDVRPRDAELPWYSFLRCILLLFRMQLLQTVHLPSVPCPVCSSVADRVLCPGACWINKFREFIQTLFLLLYRLRRYSKEGGWRIVCRMALWCSSSVTSASRRAMGSGHNSIAFNRKHKS